MDRSSTTARAPRWARICLVILPSVLLFATAEFVAWLADVPQVSRNKFFQRHEFRRDCRARERPIERRCDPANFSEAADIRSVYVFGGSSVQGHPIGVTTPFATYMQQLLNERRPGDFVVHNLGVACRDSIYVRKCSEKVGGDANDIYVVYAGHNDFGNFMVAWPRLRVFSEEHPTPFALIESTLARSRVYSLLVRWVHGEPRGKVASFSRLPDPAWSEARAVALETYRENIRELIEEAGARNIEVLLVTVVSNVSEHPAIREEWHKLMNRDRPFHEYLGPWRSHFQDGIDRFEAGDFEESLREFKQARDQAMNGRAPSALNEQIRELSDSYDHVHLVDFEKTLDRVGTREGQGCAFFGEDEWCDQFHPNERTQRLIAGDIVDVLLEERSPARAGAAE